MKEIDLVIPNPTGLHARPAKVLVNLAKKFQADISLQHGAKKANAKSMVSVLTLGATQGSPVHLQVSGVDEDAAFEALVEAINAGLGDLEPAPAAVAVSQAPIPQVTAPAASSSTLAGALRGIAASPGIGIGPVFHLEQADTSLDALEELCRNPKMNLEAAMQQAREDLARLHQGMVEKKLGAEAAIFEAHIELMEDPELHEAVQESVAGGENVVRAWQTAIEARAAMVATLPDPLLAARADDLRDVGRRVLRLMLGLKEKTLAEAGSPVIVIATDLSPSQTATFDPQRVLGFCITTGGPTAHIAILARALGLPAVVAADEGILSLPEGCMAVIDGNDGLLIPDPSPQVLEQARQRESLWQEQRRVSLAQAGKPAITLDGHHVDVTANIGSLADALEALRQGADGVGLLRTEFLFLERGTGPDEEEQFNVYRDIAAAMRNLPVIVRTLDIGGDKPVSYISMKPELNPFLGERGIRLCFNRPELFQDQLRSILRAAPYGNLRIMFPMVADVTEVRRARAILDDLCRDLNAPAVQVGIMVEVPSAALMADVIAPEVDFFSLGTNDLTQYTLAVDRGHPTMAFMTDGLHPAVLRLIAHTIDAAHKFGKRCDLCGELGADPTALPVLVGLGIDELSVNIRSVPQVKAQVRTLRLADAQSLARRALDCATPQEVRALVKAFQG